MINGNKLKKKIINYDIRNELNLFKDIKKKFSDNKIQPQTDNIGGNIIFILGMPRSGTSLVEQIISSHNEVFGGGELPILPNIIKNIFISNENLLKMIFQI